MALLFPRTASRLRIPRRWANEIRPFAGGFIRNAILLLMINAAVLGTTAISLSSAWAYGEVRGWAHSLRLPVHKAPGVYTVYVLCVAAAAGLVLIPGAPLQLLLNDKQLLGLYANKPMSLVLYHVLGLAGGAGLERWTRAACVASSSQRLLSACNA